MSTRIFWEAFGVWSLATSERVHTRVAVDHLLGITSDDHRARPAQTTRAVVTVADPYSLLELIGTIAFAVSGGAVAARAGMDWLGIAVLAVVTAVGGGTLRDLLMGEHPVAWIRHPWPVWVALATSIVVIADAHRHPRRALDARRLILVADAAGLAVFTATGTGLALAAGINGSAAVLLGVVNGVGGGVARDVLARERPLILIGQVYALTSVAGATVLVLLHDAHAPSTPSRWLAVAVALTLRLLAIRHRWSLPRPALKPRDDDTS